MKNLITFMTLSAMLAIAACDKSSDESDSGGSGDGKPSAPGRLDIPPAVRQNLGITFAKVERRHIERTLRLPGAFEFLPRSRREYRAPMAGLVDLMVEQFALVNIGDVLCRIDSPEWRKTQQELGAALAEQQNTTAQVHIAQATLLETQQAALLVSDQVNAVARHVEKKRDRLSSLRAAADIWCDRVAKLESLSKDGGGGLALELATARTDCAAAQANLSDAEAEILGHEAERVALDVQAKTHLNAVPRLEAEIAAREAHATASQSAYALALMSAAALCGREAAELAKILPRDGREMPMWSTIDRLEVRASSAGLVSAFQITQGGRAQQGDPLLTVVDPAAVRVHAQALQSDSVLLKGGMPAFITAASPSGTVLVPERISGIIRLAPESDATTRAVDVLMTPDKVTSWMRAGAATALEVVLDKTPQPALALPRACVVKDGLEMVIFLRNHADPNTAIRKTPVLGASNADWVELVTTVMDGDEVVLGGAYELMLASQKNKPTGKGHFHADGTWHAGED